MKGHARRRSRGPQSATIWHRADKQLKENKEKKRKEK